MNVAAGWPGMTSSRGMETYGWGDSTALSEDSGTSMMGMASFALKLILMLR